MNNYTFLRFATGHGGELHFDKGSKKVFRKSQTPEVIADSERTLIYQIQSRITQKIDASLREDALSILDVNIPWIFYHFYETGWSRWVKIPRTRWLECFQEWNTELNGKLVNTLIDNTVDRIWRIAKNIVDLRNLESDLRKKIIWRIYNFVRARWRNLGHQEITEIAETLYMTITYGGIDENNYSLEKYQWQQLMTINQFTTNTLTEYRRLFYENTRDGDAMRYAIRSSTGYVMDGQSYREWRNGYLLSKEWCIITREEPEDESPEKALSVFIRIWAYLSNPNLSRDNFVKSYEAILVYICSIGEVTFSLDKQKFLPDQLVDIMMAYALTESPSREVIKILEENYDRYIQCKGKN